MASKCPMCGTPGRVWNSAPEVWRCPNCMSIFSEFGMVLETETEHINLWA